jgi:long-chain acyl-CoA synthetase
VSGNLATLLGDAAAGHAARPALLLEDERIDYAALERGAAHFAGLLRDHGIGPGDRVGIMLPNGPPFVAAFHGALRLGAIVVPLNVLLKPPEVRQRVEHAGARVVVTGADVVPESATRLDPEATDEAHPVEEIVDRDPADTAVILYTSGSTGDARGVELTHGGLRSQAGFLAGPVLGLTPNDVVLGAAPFAHVFGLTGVMNAPIAAGACIVLMPRFEAAAALELMAVSGTTVLLGVPTMCIALLQAAESTSLLPPLRVAHSGGASLAPEILRAFEGRFGCQVVEGYGMTETAGPVTTHRFGHLCKPASVGTPANGMEVRVVDGDGAEVGAGEIGEVLARGAAVTTGYWHNPSATADAFREAGWLSTGDMGYVDEDGYLFLVDRKKDVIIRGGYSVYPRELEDVLYAHPGVLEAIVLGVPDSLLGEEVVALVVARPGADCDPDDVKRYVRERVAAYKYPRLVVLVEQLPRGPSGKILRREIDRAQLRRALDDSIAAEGSR